MPEVFVHAKSAGHFGVTGSHRRAQIPAADPVAVQLPWIQSVSLEQVAL
jgi:hypothetical protein